MLRSLIGRGARNENGAVASTVALSLFGLIAVGGLAIDYSRMAALDTELQQAADQAALAAVTQLNQTPNSCTFAVAAARQLITNQTKFGNDGGGLNVAIANQATTTTNCGTGPIVFYSAYTSNSSNTPTTDPLAAKFVSVTVSTRKAVYALTPIMNLYESGLLSGTAVAGLGSAICKVPPVMICNPDEPLGGTNPNLAFDVNSRIGNGMKLIGDGSYTPGAFGYLETGFGSGANNLLQAIGYNTPPGDCASVTGVKVKAGFNVSVIDGFNTRFDINANGNSCPGGDSNCSPSINVRKDLVRGNQCGITGNGWAENAANSGNYATRRYRPTSVALLPAGTAIDLMGFPRDVCHAVGASASCAGFGGSARMGNGNWDRDVYFKSNYNWTPGQWQTNTGLSASATRYQVYKWEYEHPTVTGVGASKGSININQPGQGSTSAYSTPQAGVCLAPGISPGGANVDRRRISAAVLNCQALGVNGGGNTVYTPTKWIDLFLVEPSIARTRCDGGSGGCNTQYTEKTDVYVEIVGETTSGASGATAGQVVRRDKPYLIE